MGAIITVNTSGLNSLRERLASLHKDGEKFARQAINKALANGKTSIKRHVSGRYAVSSGQVGGLIDVVKSGGSKGFGGKLVVSGRRIPIKEFSPRPALRFGPAKSGGTSRWIGLGSPVSVSIIRGAPEIVDTGFGAKMPSGHVNIFVRTGASRFPVKSMLTISIPEMLWAMKVRPLVMEDLEKAMELQLSRSIGGLLK